MKWVSMMFKKTAILLKILVILYMLLHDTRDQALTDHTVSLKIIVLRMHIPSLEGSPDFSSVPPGTTSWHDCSLSDGSGYIRSPFNRGDTLLSPVVPRAWALDADFFSRRFHICQQQKAKVQGCFFRTLCLKKLPSCPQSPSHCWFGEQIITLLSATSPQV